MPRARRWRSPGTQPVVLSVMIKARATHLEQGLLGPVRQMSRGESDLCILGGRFAKRNMETSRVMKTMLADQGAVDRDTGARCA